MMAFNNINRESEKEAEPEDMFTSMQKNFDTDEFNQRATLAANDGPVRRTALGRGTKSAASADPDNDPSIDPEAIKNKFTEAVLSKHSTIAELRVLYMNPLPEAIGPLQCYIRRDQTGVNKFSPKYYLTLYQAYGDMLQATKIQSITSHI